MTIMDHRSAPRAIARWLLMVAALVFCMVVVGGITRLTESGLSITQWKPITGAIPPLTHNQWMEAFRLYQQIPEYQEINRGMTLSQFQFIFFWEWVHRLLGRLIGVAFALPLLWFAWKRMIPTGYGWRLVALLALGGLQGAIGWWMVKSGLSVRTDVSHYRLAVHLLTALFIMGGLIWTALDLRVLARRPAARPARLRPFALAVLVTLGVQLMFGAFTAGLDAGYVSSTWPLMNDHLVPQGINWSGSFWATLSSDPYLVHFIHRWWAWIAAAMLMLLARRAKLARQRGASMALNAAVGTQILLGIATVMTGIALPLAVLHQAVGALVVAAAAWAAHASGHARGFATLLLAAAAQPVAAERIAIPFAPPVGQQLAYDIDQHRPIAGQESRFSAHRTVRFERVGDGYQLYAVLRSLDSDASDAAAASFRAALTPLIGVEMRFHLDSQGKIIALDDDEAVWSAVEHGLETMMAQFAPDTPRHRAAQSVRTLFDGLARDGRLALLAGEYQPLFLFAASEVEDGAHGRGVRTMAGSPLGRPVPVEGVLTLQGRVADGLSLTETLAGPGVDVQMDYNVSPVSGLVTRQGRTLTVGTRTLTEKRVLRPAP